MKILLASSEAVPYAKTGGLADVTGALLGCLRGMGHDARLFMPMYRCVLDNYKPVYTGIEVSPHGECGRLYTIGESVYLIDQPWYFNREELYATPQGEYPDNDRRFIFFCRAVLDAAEASGFVPDVIHCHDWQSALIPAYLRTHKRWAFPRTVSLMTIHNIGYQGIFPASSMSHTGLPPEFYTPSLMEFYGQVNFLKTGILMADAVNTVSATYAREVLTPEFGFGLEGVIADRGDVFFGIPNGLDYSEWNPSDDRLLPARYSTGDMKGKAECKKALLKACAFRNINEPVIGMVGRLAHQKGLDLLIETLPKLFALKVKVAILGRGEDDIQKDLLSLASRYPKRMFVNIGFDESLAHLIYAGSDFFIMPSRYEPCGLSQLIAMRYGTIPIVRATGGLVDTVADNASGTGTGYMIKEHAPEALAKTVRSALEAYACPEERMGLIERCMLEDFSWERSAASYVGLYEAMRGWALP